MVGSSGVMMIASAVACQNEERATRQGEVDGLAGARLLPAAPGRLPGRAVRPAAGFRQRQANPDKSTFLGPRPCRRACRWLDLPFNVEQIVGDLESQPDARP